MSDRTYKILFTLWGMLIVVMTTMMFESLYWHHQAVVHHAAFYEANTWGDVSFHWNDVSYAQTPLK
jgi:hypothetical protein